MGFIYQNHGKVIALMTKQWNFKISNFGRGRWLGQNDHLFRPWSKEKRYFSSKDLSCGHYLHINRMWKQLFWWSSSEKLNSQDFGRGTSVGQNDHYLDHIWHKKRYKFCINFYAFVFSKVREWCFDKVKIVKLKR